jgi:hypothetical protein
MSNPTKFSWVDPTVNVDGTAISAGEITSYLIGVRNTTAAGSVAGTYPITLAAPPGATSALIAAVTPALPAGLYAASVQAVTANSVSAWSTPEAVFAIAEVPAAPTGFSVA